MSKKKSSTLEDVNTAYDPEPYFALLDMYFERNNQVLVKHQIDSFDQFIEEVIPSILQDSDNIISEKIGDNKIVKYRLTFEELGIKPPMLEVEEELMFPLDAIQKNLSYSSIYTATVTQWQDIVDIESGAVESRIIGNSEKDVPIAKIPIMIKSKYCNLSLKPDLSRKHCRYDTGGYFIINGSEKVVSSVEEVVLRRPLVFTKKEQNVLSYYVQVRSRKYTQFVGNIQIFTIKMKKDNSIMLAIPHFKEISIFTVMRALGLETDMDIVNAIVDIEKDKSVLNQLSIAMNLQSSLTLSRDEACEILSNSMKYNKDYSGTNPEIKAQQKKKHLIKILSQFILPHITSETGDPNIDMLYKGYYIGMMINKLLKCFLKENKETTEHRGCDDRDAMTNKRIELPGMLLGTLFEQYFKKMLNDYAKTFRSKNYTDDSKPHNIISHIKPNTIEQGLRQALSTGTFGTRKGLAQMLSRLNYLHALSFLRRVITPTVDTATNKLTSPRHLHPTQYGSMCPLETPEGHKVGIIKNLSITDGITLTIKSQEPIIKKYLKGKYLTLDAINSVKRHRYVNIAFNGTILGVTNDIIKIHNELREMRFRGEIDKSVGLVINFRDRIYNIYTDGGRINRPLLTVDNNNILRFKSQMLDKVNTWDEFNAKYPTVIEIMDIEEQQNMMMATFPQFIEKANRLMNNPPLKTTKEINYVNKTNRYDDNVFVRYTHCEIHPSMILGVISSNMAFPDHNPGTRGHYHYNQAKQAMGIYLSDYRERTDISYILYHSQTPIVASRVRKYTGSNVFPAGENVIVAIMSYMGYNQEDSLLMNNSAIQKGLFRAQSLSKAGETIKKNPASAQTEIFMKPNRDKVDGIKDANYDKLTEDGYVKVETVIQDNDVIIGMVIPKAISHEDDNEKPYKDNSKIFRSLAPATVDKVILGVNNDNYPIIKMRIRSERIPNIGDKFACYDDQTEILTHVGWIKFEDLSLKHRVATLVDGKRLVYDYPTKIHEYDYQGKMYLVQSNQVNLCVTPNHMMWVAPRSAKGASVKIYRRERADTILGERRFYQKNVESYEDALQEISGAPFYVGKSYAMMDGMFSFAPLEHNLYASRDLPELSMKLEDWLIFFGIWIAEGCLKSDWGVCFAAHKPRVKDALIKITNEYDLTFFKAKAVRDETEQHVWFYTNKQLIKYLDHLNVGAINKYLPEWVWSLDTAHARILIHGMMLGDGHWMANGTMRYDTSSVQLADDFQRLCLHAGWSTNIKLKCSVGYETEIRGKPCICTVDAWRLTVITAQNNPIVNKTANKLDEMIDYNGKVYCCTVPSGVIYVRRNKMPVFSCNSVHGQKGTIGYKPHRADMPYTEDGIVPDIVINPNCIGRRMTIGQLIECLLSKLCAIKGIYGDATPFTGIDLHRINNDLVDYGYGAWGNQIMYSGMTSQKMESEIFIGPTFYQRLKQMVCDKAHSRARGPKQMLTHQPTEGRSRHGGLRVGEMERDVLIAHGMAQMQKERMVDNSDIYTCYVCDLCGLFASKKRDKKFYICHSCKNTTRISKITIPYPFMLFMNELRSMNCIGRIRTAKSIIAPPNVILPQASAGRK